MLLAERREQLPISKREQYSDDSASVERLRRGVVALDLNAVQAVEKVHRASRPIGKLRCRRRCDWTIR